MKRYIKIGMENKNNDISNKLLTMMIMLEIGSVLSVRSSGLEFSSVDMLFLSAVRVQKLFFGDQKILQIQSHLSSVLSPLLRIQK